MDSSLDPTQPAAAPPRKVAVVAVHGVAAHPPGENQNAMADLLLSLPPRDYAAPRLYDPFTSVGIQIPLQPVKVAPLSHTFHTGSLAWLHKVPVLGHLLDIYQEQSAEFARVRRDAALNPRYSEDSGAPPPTDTGDAGRRYTQMLMHDYLGGIDGNKYVTARLEGRRIADDTKVHIYEVLWADIAKPNNTIVQFFVAVFQLLLHLASLSRLAVDTGSAEGTSYLWLFYRRCQRYAVRLLQIYLPLMEVLLAVALASCLTTASSATQGKIWLPIVLGVVGGLGGGLILIVKIHNKITLSPWRWSVCALLPAVIGAAVPYLAVACISQCSQNPTIGADIVASIEIWLIPGAAVLYWILSNYEEIRKGVQPTGYILFALAFLYYAVTLVLNSGNVLLSAFWTSKLLLGGLQFSGMLLIAFAFAALFLGSLAWRTEKDPERRARARGAVRTSRLALALPTLGFTLVTLALWESFLPLAGRVRSDGTIFNQKILATAPPAVIQHLAGYPILHSLYALYSKFSTPVDVYGYPLRASAQYLQQTLGWAFGFQLPVTLGLLILAGFLLTWWAFPSALTEGFLAREKHQPPRDTDNATSLHMGTWLSRGLDSTSVVTTLFWMAIFLAPAAYLLVNQYAPHYSIARQQFINGSETLGTLRWSLFTTTNYIVGILFAAAATLLAGIARSGGAVLGIILDVDTYLRDSPEDAPPRALIFERYISTLRYLRAFRDADGRRYDEIVIVAHSLGALISSDLLHFLQSEYSREDEFDIPIRLLTMGNPTRQLLNRFFPYLYDWVRAKPDNGECPLPPPTLKAPVNLTEPLPDPEDLGVEHWVSAYRSGDYVGRSLWLDEWYLRTQPEAFPPAPPTLIESADGARAEMCIGAGAHTRYMDDTAPDIAWMLDKLISS